jgi:hypothetical protein
MSQGCKWVFWLELQVGEPEGSRILILVLRVHRMNLGTRKGPGKRQGTCCHFSCCGVGLGRVGRAYRRSDKVSRCFLTCKMGTGSNPGPASWSPWRNLFTGVKVPTQCLLDILQVLLDIAHSHCPLTGPSCAGQLWGHISCLASRLSSRWTPQGLLCCASPDHMDRYGLDRWNLGVWLQELGQ